MDLFNRWILWIVWNGITFFFDFLYFGNACLDISSTKTMTIFNINILTQQSKLKRLLYIRFSVIPLKTSRQMFKGGVDGSNGEKIEHPIKPQSIIYIWYPTAINIFWLDISQAIFRNQFQMNFWTNLLKNHNCLKSLLS